MKFYEILTVVRQQTELRLLFGCRRQLLQRRDSRRNEQLQHEGATQVPGDQLCRDGGEEGPAAE